VISWGFRPLWLDFFGPHSRKGITMSELSNRMIRDMQLAGQGHRILLSTHELW